jgi:formyl-CoA transferase
MWELQHSAVTGTSLRREGSHHPNIKAPYGIYTSADGVAVFFVSALTDDAWSSFWIFAGKPEVILMEEWNTPGKRIGNAGSDTRLAEIRGLMGEAIGAKTFAELEAFFIGEPEIIWERVREHADVLTDPQNLANDYVVDMEVAGLGKIKTVGSLIAFSATPTAPPRPPPELGSSTAEVMGELGFNPADVESVQTHAEAARAEMLAALLGES